MTAYRYVRTGRLNATKERGQWWVKPEELADIAVGARRTTPVDDGAVAALRPGAERLAVMLRRRAVAGDDAGAWSVIVEAMASGMEPARIHTDMVVPALEEIGRMWAAGDLSIVDEHQATAVTQRILGRMTPMFRHPGRRRATAVVGMVAGDFHALPSAILADLLSNSRMQVIDLGANTPAQAFIDAADSVDGAVAIGMCGLDDQLVPVMHQTFEEVRDTRPEIPIFLGGPVGVQVGPTVSCNGYSRTAEEAVALFESFARVRA